MKTQFQTTYVLSAVKPDHFPPPNLSELALSGRSNVGKSSLLNFLVGHSSMAKVSKTPGKTRAINFFEVDSRWRLVDLPGYGYARLSKGEIDAWRTLIDTYLRNRECLKGVIQLIDSRHPPLESDLKMIDWLMDTNIPAILVLTKVDKLGKNQQRSLLHTFRKEWLSGVDWPVVATSALEKAGRNELLEAVEKTLNLP
ncbi:MAG: putative GTP-binding protein EngB [bacterium]|nr:putative GTP-binding protein EngB [bacterium]